jgi:hypothetical protein
MRKERLVLARRPASASVWCLMVSLFGGVLLSAGCGERHRARANEPPVGSELMAPDHELRAVDRVVAVHVAAGAFADAMLWPHHFAGHELNALGREKLDAMRRHVEDDERLDVYLSMPGGDPDSAARRDAVTRYLTDSGLPDDRLNVRFGLNPTVNPTSTLPTPSGGAARVDEEARGRTPPAAPR